MSLRNFMALFDANRDQLASSVHALRANPRVPIADLTQDTSGSLLDAIMTADLRQVASDLRAASGPQIPQITVSPEPTEPLERSSE